MLEFHGQRWLFEDGNNFIRLENAFAFKGACQERVTVNDEIVHDRTDAMYFAWRWTPLHVCPWLTPAGEQTLSLEVRSGFSRALARLRIDGVVRPWTDYLTARWTGPLGLWPE